MDKKVNYFDITILFKVMEANGWTEGKNFMKFWSEGKAKVAAVDQKKKKSTINVNLNQGLRIYTINWSWLNSFKVSVTKYNELLQQKIRNSAAQALLVSKYGRPANDRDIISPFNDWLVDGMQPVQYMRNILQHQLQYIPVNSYELNGKKFDDLVAALNGFNFYAFYKGQIVNGTAFRTNQKNCGTAIFTAKPGAPVAPQSPSGACIKDPLARVPADQRGSVAKLLMNPSVKNVVCVTHVGVYAGDIYEFNGKQYLATWDTVNNKVRPDTWDYMFSNGDTSDPKNITVTNDTYIDYRNKTGNGGDFLALSPVKLVPLSITLPV